MTFKTTFKPVALAVMAMLAAGAAQAGETITLENGVNIDWRVNINYTLSQRMKSADPLLANSAATNDGNNNFKKGALTANRVSVLFESKISKDNTGFVLTGSTFYDDVYHSRNDNPGRLVSKPGAVNEFTAEAKRFHGGYSRILDAYGYTSFDIGESRATLRLGRQAVNWGEAVFFQNIAQAQGPFDGTKTGVAGTETKDVILGEDQLVASIEVTPRWTLLGQVQFGFHPTIPSAPGSFLSTSDGVGPGGTCNGIYVGPVCGGFSRGADIRPDETGQWGIGTRYRVTDDTEVGLYYLNYNDRTPTVVLQPKPPTFRVGTYQVKYFDDVKLLGTTVSTKVLNNTSGYMELTHREGVPLLVGALATPTRAKATQLNLGTFTNFGRMPIADSVTFLAEIATVKYSGYDGPKSGLTFKTDAGTALATTLVLGYPGIFEGWDLTVPISYQQQLSGRTLVGSFGGGKGDKRYSVGASFIRGGNLSIGVTYLGFAGGASTDSLENRVVADRDQLSLNMKYSF